MLERIRTAAMYLPNLLMGRADASHDIVRQEVEDWKASRGKPTDPAIANERVAEITRQEAKRAKVQ